MTFAYMLLAAAFVLVVWAGNAAPRDTDEAQGAIVTAGAALFLATIILAMVSYDHEQTYHAGDESACEEVADAEVP